MTRTLSAQIKQFSMISSSGNTITFSGNLSKDLNGAVSCLYKACGESELKNVTLDFQKTTYVDAYIMLPICSYCLYYKLNGTSFDLHLPSDPTLSRLFVNTNWLNLIQPNRASPTIRRRSNNLPALQFLDDDAQHNVVNQAINILTETVRFDDRKKLKALEWSIHEITDNVINHSESAIGGLLQLQCFPARNEIAVYVADAGLGIPFTLRRALGISSDSDALDQAIREGVTRNSKTNQGNGLFGTFKCCEVSEGSFVIKSNRATLRYDRDGFSVRGESTPFRGSLIAARINYSSENLLDKALVFKGKNYEPQHDYIDSHFNHIGEQTLFNVIEEVDGFGSREYGRRARTKIDNILLERNSKILFDFINIPVISSSFADEVFGKLFSELGPMDFMSRISFTNVDPTVKKLIDRSISQRMKTDTP